MPKPEIIYQSLTGHRLDLVFRPHGQPYTDQQRVDGKPVDYQSFPLCGNPWVNQPLGGDVLTIHHGQQELVYNFKTWTRTGTAHAGG